MKYVHALDRTAVFVDARDAEEFAAGTNVAFFDGAFAVIHAATR